MDKITAATVEVEGFTRLDELLDKVVVGKIITIELHPKADRLKVCKVDIGERIATIVCGGSNLREEMLVAVAQIGARVRWHGEDAITVIEPATIRGVASDGMIAGADEIGLAEFFPAGGEKEIVDLSSFKTKPGTPVAEALGLSDTILEIDNKSLSNRPDLLGHLGLAREVAALFDVPMSRVSPPSLKSGKEARLNVTVSAQEACERYQAVVIDGVEATTPSPWWLTTRLSALGIQPINAIVDCTNYVMLELGQPLHAFDAASFEESDGSYAIHVRMAHKAEKLELLDSTKLNLTEHDLVIASSREAAGLAGIKGGQLSGVHTTTKRIILEAAVFDAATIRIASAHHHLRTEASGRYEKSLDPELTSNALERAVELLTDIFPDARVISPVADWRREPFAPRIVSCPTAFINEMSGLDLSADTITGILERLGCEVQEKKGTLTVTIPSWRQKKDLTRPEDLVEEVVRLVGYETLPHVLPHSTLATPEPSPERTLLNQIKTIAVLAHNALDVYTYSFVSDTQIAHLNEKTADYLRLANPLSAEKPYLRRSLLPNLLEVLAAAEHAGGSIRLFEAGRVFVPPATANEDILPDQPYEIAFLAADKKDHQPFFTVKRFLESIEQERNISFTYRTPAQPTSYQHPTRSADIICDDRTIGRLFELHPDSANRFGIESRVGVALLLAPAIAALQEGVRTFPAPSPYPSVTRDVTFTTAPEVTHESITAAAADSHALLKKTALIDVFIHNDGAEQRTYRFTFHHNEHTLTTQEADAAEKAVIDHLTSTLALSVRT